MFNVYWSRAGSNTDIDMCPISGCASSPQAIELSQAASFVQIDGLNMYWTNGTQFFFASIGTTPQLVFMRDSIWHFAFDQTYVFWANPWDGYVERCINKKTLCVGLTQLATAPAPDRVVLDATNVYWNSSWGNVGSIWQCAKAGCGGTPTLIATTTLVTGLAVDDTCVYWTAGDSVLRVAKP